MEDWRHIPSPQERKLPNPDQEELGFKGSREYDQDSEVSLAAEGIKKNPKAIFEHVVAAAERKEAMERLYELRQELKGVSSSSAADPASDQHATSVGGVLADAPMLAAHPTLAAPTNDKPQSPQPSVPRPLQEDGDQPITVEGSEKGSIYRSAMVTGFITAILLLVGFAVFLWLRG